MITDLANVGALQIVEREKLNQVLVGALARRWRVAWSPWDKDCVVRGTPTALRTLVLTPELRARELARLRCARVTPSGHRNYGA